MAPHNCFEHRVIVVGILILHKNAHTFVFINDDLPFIRFQFPGQNFQKSGFARSVSAYNTVAIPLGKL